MTAGTLSFLCQVLAIKTNPLGMLEEVLLKHRIDGTAFVTTAVSALHV